MKNPRAWMLVFRNCMKAMGLVVAFSGVAHASISDIRRAYESGQYFSAARIAFNDANQTASTSDKALYYAWVTDSLVHAGLDQSAVYFFIRTLQFGDLNANRRVLEYAPLFIARTSADLMRKFLLKYSRADDYSPRARNAYYLVIAKEKLMKGLYAEAAGAAALVRSGSSLYSVALQIKGTAEVMLNQQKMAIEDFKRCSELDRVEEPSPEVQSPVLMKQWDALRRDSASDLRARCKADLARVYYELGQFEEADRMYDSIPKSSFVWTDTLFEHAWATYAREEYNRSLGKLVSYKSPALQFVFNSEIDVLTAQSYSSLCLFEDAGKIIEDFSRRVGSLARDVKAFISRNPADAGPYYELGKQVLADKLNTRRTLHQFMNRFVRSPNFQALALSEDRAQAEKIAIARLDASRPDVRTKMGTGFPAFLKVVLDWRIRTVKLLGGIFIRNSMIDYHQILISDLEKMQFMKIDILSHQRRKLMQPEVAANAERGRGNRIPVRRDDQYLWGFNGEFWNDELGDYVFALESECGKGLNSSVQ